MYIRLSLTAGCTPPFGSAEAQLSFGNFLKIILCVKKQNVCGAVIRASQLLVVLFFYNNGTAQSLENVYKLHHLYYLQ